MLSDVSAVITPEPGNGSTRSAYTTHRPRPGAGGARCYGFSLPQDICQLIQAEVLAATFLRVL